MAESQQVDTDELLKANGLTPEQAAEMKRQSQIAAENANGAQNQLANENPSGNLNEDYGGPTTAEAGPATGSSSSDRQRQLATGLTSVQRQTGGFLGIGTTPMTIYRPNTVVDQNYDANKAAVASIAGQISARPDLTMNGSTIATGPQSQSRDFQMNALDMMRSAAVGGGPSVAQQQLKTGADRTMAANLAMAAAAGTPGAQRQAAFNNAAATQDLAGQSANLRANEMIAARGQLSQASEGVRGQDIGFATSQAMLDNDKNKTNLQAQIDQQKTKDVMVQQYLSMGMSLDQANMQAEIQQRQYQAGILSQQEAARQGVSINNGAQALQLGGAAASAIGTYGASLIDKIGHK